MNPIPLFEDEPEVIEAIEEAQEVVAHNAYSAEMALLATALGTTKHLSVSLGRFTLVTCAHDWPANYLAQLATYAAKGNKDVAPESWPMVLEALKEFL